MMWKWNPVEYFDVNLFTVKACTKN